MFREQVTSVEMILMEEEGIMEVLAQSSFAASAMCRHITLSLNPWVPTSRGSAPMTPLCIPLRLTLREETSCSEVVKNKGNYYCSTEDRATEAQNRHTAGAQKVIDVPYPKTLTEAFQMGCLPDQLKDRVCPY